MKNQMSILAVLTILSVFALSVIPASATATLTLPSQHIPGQTVTITVDGLTIGSDYYINTDNDAGLTTIVFSAIATKMYFDRSMEEDSDLSFSLKIWEYNGTAPGFTETALDTVYVTQVKADTYIDTDLFIAFLAPLVLLGIIALIVGGILWSKR